MNANSSPRPFLAQEDDDPLAQALSAGRAEADAAQTYVLSKRLRIASIVALAFGGLLCVFVVLFGSLFAWRLPSEQASAAWYSILLLICCIMLFGIAYRAATKKHIGLATTLTLIATDVTIVWFLAFWSIALDNKGDAITLIQFVSFSLAISLAGAIGNRKVVILTTIFMNAVTVALVYAFFQSDQALLLIIGILQQWTAATLAIVIVTSYQQTLREVSMAYVQSRQLEELKDRFITNVHHELRTPVMTVLGYLDFLQRSWQKLPPEKLALNFQKAREVGDHLMHLIQSILDVRRIDERHIDHPEPVVVRAICDIALQLVDPGEAKLADRQITFDMADGLAVWGEQVRLQQVMTNLLSNAGKYSPPGTPIAVAAAIVNEPIPGNEGKRNRGAKKHSMVEITVRDYGWGIPPDQGDLLFNRFVRLPRDLASTTVGNGLGLYLCRALVTAMGGTIWVESAGVSGEGSTFHIRLPWCPEPAPQQPATPA